MELKTKRISAEELQFKKQFYIFRSSMQPKREIEKIQFGKWQMNADNFLTLNATERYWVDGCMEFNK